MKFGKRYCPSHYIKMQDMDAIVLKDIRSLALEDEEKAKAESLARKAKHHEEQYSVDTKKSQKADTAYRSLPVRCVWYHA